MMFHLPPPPRFILPPPPTFPSEKMLLQLTCSSIRHQQQQQIDPQLILISCFILFIIVIFLTISLNRRQKTLTNNLNSKISRDLSIYTNRSYETISSGIYLESVNTTNPCHEISSSPLYYNVLPC
jgi:hypothetical protein